jgi:2-polyprenyl-6-hydroxyphenyl methylase/3-demethylubiquinone-9 3-methyltransferase
MNLNADPQELTKFSDLAHRWWDPESEFRPLHEINPLRLDWIESHVRLAGKRVLDGAPRRERPGYRPRGQAA